MPAIRNANDFNDISISGTQRYQTPPGFNKSQRDIARSILWLVFVAIFVGENVLAAFFSATAIVVLKEGTLFSHKNLKWMLLSVISFCASLFAWQMAKGSEAIDENRAYALKMLLWLMAKSIQMGWSVTLGFFLLLASASESQSQQY
mmetsp:Transcript_9578/g.16710  ORF Transcript_9578/g.16710 Transcript_9578/m.16710 type:complete len:147 (+) Transcript_9578:116-556(+)|eukprot:CAMPEP_0184454694 /NCGR_PEP_ID=MMETSP0740-20130409/20900_1 /TAXON_ID=385413 /ORGANISM="Thalassiosira miniscula, Strain CCMP1093" /LENGTH=146 /DNA_ID=CAMNT_0026826321 /DNA_START=56 /DNA_END=496 /DNA_ORIENTATION=+